eukprot:SAG31_NODE_79_length_27235_cov_6.268868_1_plen_204_part_00
MWPYSTSSECPTSKDDQRVSSMLNQKLDACTARADAKSLEQKGMNAGQARGAVEIDIFEVLPGPIMTDKYGNRDCADANSFQRLIDSGSCPPDMLGLPWTKAPICKPAMTSSLQISPGFAAYAYEQPSAPCNPTKDQWYPGLFDGTSDVRLMCRLSMAGPFMSELQRVLKRLCSALYHGRHLGQMRQSIRGMESTSKRLRSSR